MVDRESDGAARGSTGTFAQPGESGVDDADPDRVAQFFDAVAYAAATTVVFGVFSGVVTLAVGGRFAPGVKFGLFVFGWVAFGYGTLLLWPEAAWKDDDDEGARSASSTARGTARHGLPALRPAATAGAIPADTPPSAALDRFTGAVRGGRYDGDVHRPRAVLRHRP